MVGQARSTQRHLAAPPSDEPRLVTRVIELATVYGRYGYRRITALLRREGWRVNHKRIERIWRQEGLKVPQRQPKRGRIWLNDGSCMRRRSEYPNHVWSYDFVLERTPDGRPLRMLAVMDEYTRECLAIKVERRLGSQDVLECLADLFVHRGTPVHIRSDNGPEFTAHAVRRWLERVGVKTLFIEPGSPWENGYVESFIGKLRDELLNREILYTLTEAKVLVVAASSPDPHMSGSTPPCRAPPVAPESPHGRDPAPCSKRSAIAHRAAAGRLDEFGLPEEAWRVAA